MDVVESFDDYCNDVTANGITQLRTMSTQVQSKLKHFLETRTIKDLPRAIPQSKNYNITNIDIQPETTSDHDLESLSYLEKALRQTPRRKSVYPTAKPSSERRVTISVNGATAQSTRTQTSVRKETDGLGRKIRGLESTVREKEEKISFLQAEQSRLVEMNEQNLGTVKRLKRQIKRFEEEQTEHKENLDRIVELEKEIEQMEVEAQEREKMAQGLQKTLKEVEMKVAEAKEREDRLEKEIEEKAQGIIDEYETKLAEKDDEFQKFQTRARGKLAKNKERVKNAKVKVKRFAEAMKELEDKEERYIQERETLTKEFEEAYEKFKEEQEAIYQEKYEQKLNDAEEQLTKVNAALEKMSDEYSALENSIEEQKDEAVKNSRKQFEERFKLLKAKQKTRAQAKMEKLKLKYEQNRADVIEALQVDQNAEIEQISSSFEKEIHDLKKKIQKFESLLAAEKEEHKSLRDQMDSTIGDKDAESQKLLSESHALTKFNNLLKEKIASLEKQNEQTKAELAKRKREMSFNQTQLEKKQSMIVKKLQTEHSSEIDSYKNEIEELKSTLARVQEDLAAAKARKSPAAQSSSYSSVESSYENSRNQFITVPTSESSADLSIRTYRSSSSSFDYANAESSSDSGSIFKSFKKNQEKIKQQTSQKNRINKNLEIVNSPFTNKRKRDESDSPIRSPIKKPRYEIESGAFDKENLSEFSNIHVTYSPRKSEVNSLMPPPLTPSIKGKARNRAGSMSPSPMKWGKKGKGKTILEYKYEDERINDSDLRSWVQKDNLAAALNRQKHINPEDIFGDISMLAVNLDSFFTSSSSRKNIKMRKDSVTMPKVTSHEKRLYKQQMNWN